MNLVKLKLRIDFFKIESILEFNLQDKCNIKISKVIKKIYSEKFSNTIVNF